MAAAYQRIAVLHPADPRQGGLTGIGGPGRGWKPRGVVHCGATGDGVGPVLWCLVIHRDIAAGEQRDAIIDPERDARGQYQRSGQERITRAAAAFDQTHRKLAGLVRRVREGLAGRTGDIDQRLIGRLLRCGCTLICLGNLAADLRIYGRAARIQRRLNSRLVRVVLLRCRAPIGCGSGVGAGR